MEEINSYCEKNGLVFKEWVDSGAFRKEPFLKYYFQFLKNGKVDYEQGIDISNKGFSPLTVALYSTKSTDEYTVLMLPVLEIGRKEVIETYINKK